MNSFVEQLHPSWKIELHDCLNLLSTIEEQIWNISIAPDHNKVLRSLSYPLDHIKVLMVGQDPYPTPGYASGLAFSVERNISKLPLSLRNIKKELEDDLAISLDSHGDLSSWAVQGVCLLNRTLTTLPGKSNAHVNIGWKVITNRVAQILGKRDVVALLLGNNAQELRNYFRPSFLIEEVHPSPLSARRGFFGSKVFSRINQKLIEASLTPIDWHI